MMKFTSIFSSASSRFFTILAPPNFPNLWEHNVYKSGNKDRVCRVPVPLKLWRKIILTTCTSALQTHSCELKIDSSPVGNSWKRLFTPKTSHTNEKRGLYKIHSKARPLVMNSIFTTNMSRQAIGWILWWKPIGWNIYMYIFEKQYTSFHSSRDNFAADDRHPVYSVYVIFYI